MQKGEEKPTPAAGENKRIPDKAAADKPLTPSGLEEKRGAVRTDEAKTAQRLVERARQEFARDRFAEAGILFEEAQRTDQQSFTGKSKDQWAYCKLHHVVEQLNRKDAANLVWSDLEGEVRQALTLAVAPRLEETGKDLLREIQKRRQDGEGRIPDQQATVKVQHLERTSQGWYVAETANFRIFHKQDRELVEKVACAAEDTRATMTRKWFGKAGEDWNPKCSLYLHDTAQDYSRLTGVSASSPGHSRIETEGERVVGRRIDVRCDNAGMLKSVLPHETTHVVLAGKFGKGPVPRWADEGMAVLTEPTEKVELHRKNLARCHKEGQLFAVRDLMELADYPHARRISAFYAQSVSLVDFLSRQHGPAAFSVFLREALRDGYEPALKKHYNFRSFDELQASWSEDAFAKSGSYEAGLKGRYR
jgi:hypothetical protein